MYIFLEKLSSDFIVREHAPACTGRRQQYRFSRLGQFGTQLQAFLIGICETDLIKAMLSGTLGNLLSGLADEDKALYLAIKAVDPLIVLALLVIASAYQHGRLAHGFDALDRRIGIGSLGIVVIVHTALGSHEFDPGAPPHGNRGSQ